MDKRERRLRYHHQESDSHLQRNRRPLPSFLVRVPCNICNQAVERRDKAGSKRAANNQFLRIQGESYCKKGRCKAPHTLLLDLAQPSLYLREESAGALSQPVPDHQDTEGLSW